MILLALAVASWLAQAAPTPTPTFGPNARLDRCDKSMAPLPPFPSRKERPGLRLVVTRYHGASKESEDLGAELGSDLERAILEYAKSQQTTPLLRPAGFTPDELQVRHVPCLVNSHAEARAVGLVWGADVVMWGQAYAATTSSRAIKRQRERAVDDAQGLCIACDNVITAKNVQVVGIQIVARTGGRFKTSLTVVHWSTLEATGKSHHLEEPTAMDLDFPALATNQPRALLHVVLAMYAADQGRHAVAAALFEQAQKLPGFTGQRHPDIQRLLGRSLLMAGQPKRGVAALNAALSGCATDTSCRAIALNNLGSAYYHLGDNEKALKLHHLALPLRAGNVYGEAATLNNIGLVHDDLGDKTKALEFYNLALPLVRQAGNLAGEAAALNNIGSVHDDLGDKTKALEFYNLALALAHQADNITGEAITLNMIGRVHADLGDKTKALESYNLALPLRRQAGDIKGEATTLNMIGRVHADLGDRTKALEFYNLALPLHRQAGDIKGEATTLNNIGRVRSDLGDKTKALEFYNLALARRRQAGDIEGEAAALNDIGSVHSDLGDKTKALEFYNLARGRRRQTNDLNGEAVTLNNIGLVHSALGEKTKALEFYNLALPLYRQASNIAGEAGTLNNIASSHSALGDKDKALEFFNLALPLYRQARDIHGEATALNNIGSVRSDLGNKTEALEFYSLALSLYRQARDIHGEATTLGNIGSLQYALGDKTKALEFYNLALPPFRQTGDIASEATLHNNIAFVQHALGDHLDAALHFRTAARLYMSRKPPNTQNATSSLALAFESVLAGHLIDEGKHVLKAMRELAAPELDLAEKEATLLGFKGGEVARRAYQKLAALAAKLTDPRQRRNLTIRADAGRERALHGAVIESCRGIVILEVLPGSQAAATGLRPGDILLKYNQTCLSTADDLVAATGKPPAAERVPLRLWRAGAGVDITLTGGKLGVSITSF